VSPQRFYPTSIDGVLHAPGEGFIRSDDQGFLSGLSVFDTLLYEDGCRYFEAQHLARLENGAAALSIARPLPWDIPTELARYCAALGPRNCAVRITLTRGVLGRGPTLVIGARDIVPPPEPGVVVVLVKDAKLAGDPLENIKSTNRLRNFLAREAALAAGAFEALLCTHAGDVSEGTLSNVFAQIDGTVVTPGLDRGALSGVMRGEVLAELRACGREVAETVLEPEALARASEIFLTNTTGRVIPVLEVRDLVRGLPGAAGELARDLRQRIRAREQAYRRSREGGGAE
jgi:branched-subunit amino acid aminotransferase/4-amino-4-deoxychorismate lyase